MNHRYNRRPPKRRITGRFYAFMTVLLVLVVMLCVFLNMRGRVPQQAYNPVVFDPNASVVTAPPADAPVVASNPNQAQAQTPTAPPQVQQTAVDAQSPATGDDAPVADPAQQAPQVGDDIVLPSADFAVIEDLKARTDLPPEWTNILLLGSDSRDMKKVAKTRCDTIMIVSVNGQTGQMKMTSIMRDTIIEIPGHGMQKINAATYYGGPRLLIQLLNTHLGLNITQYAIVNFVGMAGIIDILDGVFIGISEEEARQINHHMGEIAEFSGMSQADYLAQKEQIKLTTWGKNIRLTGIQAVTYARIREIDTDYQRTQRQRNVINAMMARVKDANPIQLMQIGTQMLTHLETNVGITNAVGYAMSVLNCNLEKDRIKEWRIPGEETSKSKNGTQGQGFYDVNYPELAARIFKFIYQT